MFHGPCQAFHGAAVQDLDRAAQGSRKHDPGGALSPGLADLPAARLPVASSFW